MFAEHNMCFSACWGDITLVYTQGDLLFTHTHSYKHNYNFEV